MASRADSTWVTAETTLVSIALAFLVIFFSSSSRSASSSWFWFLSGTTPNFFHRFQCSSFAYSNATGSNEFVPSDHQSTLSSRTLASCAFLDKALWFIRKHVEHVKHTAPFTHDTATQLTECECSGRTSLDQVRDQRAQLQWLHCKALQGSRRLCFITSVR